MEAVFDDLDSAGAAAFRKALCDFFSGQSPKVAQEYCWHLFRGWVNLPKEQKKYSDDEMALFLDRLIILLGAAFILQQGDVAPGKSSKGKRRD